MARQKEKAGPEGLKASSPQPRAGRRRTMQPPLTPMIDVTFQLLLFFLLTCEFRESEGSIPGTLPAIGRIAVSRQPPPPQPDPIRIQVRPSANREAAVYQVSGVLGTIAGPAELYGHLRRLQGRLGGADVPVVIAPKRDVPWEFVVEAFNQAVRARFRKIGFPDQAL
jgi:biopolymer transport protein ExbD